MNQSQLIKFLVVPVLIVAAIAICQPVSARNDTPWKAISPKSTRVLSPAVIGGVRLRLGGQHYGVLQILHRNIDPASDGRAGEPMRHLFESGGFVCNSVDALDVGVSTGRYSDPSVPSWIAYLTCQIDPTHLTGVRRVASYNEMYETCDEITCDFTFESLGSSKEEASVDGARTYWVGKFENR